MEWSEVLGLLGCVLVSVSTYEVLGWYNIILVVGILLIVYCNIYRFTQDFGGLIFYE